MLGLDFEIEQRRFAHLRAVRAQALGAIMTNDLGWEGQFSSFSTGNGRSRRMMTPVAFWRRIMLL
jgi:hypothetical protein